MKVRDPVCGMTLVEKDAAASIQHEGKTYYFCSDQCRERFQANPGAYAEKG